MGPGSSVGAAGGGRSKAPLASRIINMQLLDVDGNDVTPRNLVRRPETAPKAGAHTVSLLGRLAATNTTAPKVTANISATPASVTGVESDKKKDGAAATTTAAAAAAAPAATGLAPPSYAGAKGSAQGSGAVDPTVDSIGDLLAGGHAHTQLDAASAAEFVMPCHAVVWWWWWSCCC